MAKKPTNEGLQQRVKELEKEADERKQVENELRKAHKELKQKIKERTSNLLKINKQLKGEINWRKQSEAALGRLASFPEQNPDPVIEINPEGKVTYLNPKALTQFPDLPLTALQHPTLEGLQSIMVSLRSERQEAFTREIVLNDLFYEQKITYAPGKNLIRIFFRDITERKRAEEALRNSEEQYRTLVEGSADAIISIDEKMKIIQWNNAAFKIFGYPAEEALGNPVDMIIPEKHQRDHLEGVNRFLETGNGPLIGKTVEIEGVRKDSATIPIELSLSALRQKESWFFTTIIRDISDRKDAEKTLRESELWIGNIFKSLKEAVFVITPDRIFLDMNEAALEMFGYTKEELVNLPSDIAHVDHAHYLEFGTKMEEVLNTGGVINFQFKMRRKNGEIFPSEHSASLMVDNEGNPIGIVSVVRDLSEQKKIEEEKERLRTQLEESKKMEAIGTLAGGIAHEFNNALTGVVGNIELLEMRLPDNKTVTEHTEPMKSSSHRMANLTSQLLAYARGGRYQAKTISLSDFVEETLPVIKSNIGPSIHIDTDLPRDIFKVNVDSAQMQMVLSALVNNSAEAIEGEGHIRLILSNKGPDAEFAKGQPDLTPGPYVCLTVEDDGKGMDEETVNKIFDPFYTTKFIGRGLGMASVYGIIRNHGGSISVDSDLGKGTVVRIYFPAFEDKEEDRSEKPAEGVGVISGTGTILVIEDEETVMNVIRDILDKLGYRMLEAKTGKAAIEIAESFDGQIDLALLDIKLPDIWGDIVYPLIMKARPNLKVIVCSGYSINGPAQTILDAGAQDFIQKPFSVKELSQKLSKILEKE